MWKLGLPSYSFWWFSSIHLSLKIGQMVQWCSKHVFKHPFFCVFFVRFNPNVAVLNPPLTIGNMAHVQVYKSWYPMGFAKSHRRCNSTPWVVVTTSAGGAKLP
jgi:hypothetical protein